MDGEKDGGGIDGTGSSEMRTSPSPSPSAPADTTQTSSSLMDSNTVLEETDHEEGTDVTGDKRPAGTSTITDTGSSMLPSSTPNPNPRASLASLQRSASSASNVQDAAADGEGEVGAASESQRMSLAAAASSASISASSKHSAAKLRNSTNSTSSLVNGNGNSRGRGASTASIMAVVSATDLSGGDGVGAGRTSTTIQQQQQQQESVSAEQNTPSQQRVSTVNIADAGTNLNSARRSTADIQQGSLPTKRIGSQTFSNADRGESGQSRAGAGRSSTVSFSQQGAAKNNGGANDDDDDANVSDDDVEDADNARTILGSILQSGASLEVLNRPTGNGTDQTQENGGTGTGGDTTNMLTDKITEDTSPDADKALFEDLQKTLDYFNLQSQQPGTRGDAMFERLKPEYDRLHKLFLQSRQNERKLLSKCKDLTSELVANATKVQAALKLSQNDRSTITGLRKEVKKAWKMVESGGEKDTRSKEVIASLKAEIEGLRKSLAERGISASVDPNAALLATAAGRNKLVEMQISQDETIKELTKEKEALKSKIEESESRCRTFQSELESLQSQIYSLTSERGSLDVEILSLKDLLATKKSELDRDTRTREKLETTLRSHTELLKQKDIEIKTHLSDSKQLREHITKLESFLRDEKVRFEKAEKDKELLMGRFNRLQQEHEEQVLTITRLLSENQQQSGEIKGWEEELARYREEIRNVTRAKDSLTKRIKILEESKLEADLERDQLKVK
ncbi:hypothetical protein HK102_007310 [Quaeritorhiza haematococci]|nr:hypothetical protein HK102_007310 [Quaeritorhiza haematococci]